MIIEAGYDLEILAHPYCVGPTALPDPLVVIELDADLFCFGPDLAPALMGDSFDPHVPGILDGLLDSTRYLALARRGVANHQHEYRSSDPLQPSRERLKQALGARGILLFNELIINDNGWISRGPAKRFRTYPLDGGNFLPWTITKFPPRAEEAFAQHLRAELTGDDTGWDAFAGNFMADAEDRRAEAERIVARRQTVPE